MDETSASLGTGKLDDASDQQLVELVRAGDARAYATLWRRHAGAAYGVARTFTLLDADDLVSEAFTKVLGAIHSGGGPARAFRPYITMTVRNIGRSLHVREAVLVDTDFHWHGTDTANGEVAAVADFERSVTLDAFHSLPVRWQEVLWYSEVDGLKVGTIGTYLGIPANAVSALLLRAKRGLRDAWVSAHLATATSPDCATTIRELGAYTRRRASRRSAAAVEAHLAGCASCRSAHEEARHASSLILSLLPLVAGVAGAAGYAATLTAPPLPLALAAAASSAAGGGASATTVATGAPGALAASALAAPALATPAALTVTGLVGAAVTAILGVVTVVIVTAQPVVTTVETAPWYPPYSFSSAALPTPAPTSFVRASLPAPDADAIPLPDPDAAPPADSAPPAASEPAPPADVLPVAPGAIAPSEGLVDAEDASGDETSRISTHPTSPSDEGEAPPALAAALTQSDIRFYPRVSGADAHPGASIALIDEQGFVVGAGAADELGRWTVPVVDGASGRHAVHAVQIVGDQVSPPSAEMFFDTAPPPLVSHPADGGYVVAPCMTLVISAQSFSVVQREIVGVVSPELVPVPSSGVWQENLAVPPGHHTVRVRYVDAQTGEFGPVAEATFDAY